MIVIIISIDLTMLRDWDDRKVYVIKNSGEVKENYGEGNGNSLQYSFLENSTDKGPGGLQSMESQRVRHNITHSKEI